MEKSNKAIISIIIPVFNGAGVIEQTINRILASTYSRLEVIVVDDGSSDNSLAICEKLQQQDDRIKVYGKKNEGVAEARNHGVSKATGDYICFCDQDDIVEEEMYQRMLERIQMDHSQICMCSTGRSIDGKKSAFEISEDTCYKEKSILEQLLYPIIFNGFNAPENKANRRRYPHIWNCMFQKEFWDRYQFQFRFYVNYEDDLLMKIDTLTRAQSVSTISYVGYYWNVNLRSETYRHNYVENLVLKQQSCYEDMLRCVERVIKEEQTLKEFTRVTYCKQYLEAIHNLTSPHKKKTYGIIKNYYKETIYERDFHDNIMAMQYVSKGQVKARVLLPLIKHKLTTGSYMAEKMIDFVMLISLHSQLLTKLERKIKE